MVILFEYFRTIFDFFSFSNKYEELEANLEAIHTNATSRIHWKYLNFIILPLLLKLHFYEFHNKLYIMNPGFWLEEQ